MKATIFKNHYDSKNPVHVEVNELLNRIRLGKQKESIEQIRNGNKAKKNDLPLVLFSGTFKGRKDEDLQEHSGLIVLDFDHINVDASKPLISSDDFVYACWVSPSGDGLKVLVRVSHPERHRDHFRSLQEYFDKLYNIEADSTGINESRGCYESYDPDIVVNHNSKTYTFFLTEKAKSQEAVIEDGVATDYSKLDLAAKMIRSAEDGDKHAVLLKASILLGGYIAAGRVEEEEAIHVLLREISKRDIDSEAVAKNTIRDGIEHGKMNPITETIKNTNDYNRELLVKQGDMSFLSSYEEDLQWINDYANGKITLGLETGSEELDKYFRYKKEFVIINGHSNVGKTTMALYLMVNSAVRHKWKWLVYSSENNTHSLKATLMEFAFNKPVQCMTYEQRKIAYDWVTKMFVIINNKELYSYMDMITFTNMVRAQQEIDAVFIDPYNSLKIDMRGNSIGTHEYHYEAASEFLTYSSYNNIAVWLNMHAVTEAQRRKGDDNLPIAPYAEDTEGGGKFVNRSDCFLTIHRKVQSPIIEEKLTTELHVRKVREVKTGGQPTPLDSPVLFRINPDRTGFTSSNGGGELFQSIDTEFDNYKEFFISTKA